VIVEIALGFGFITQQLMGQSRVPLRQALARVSMMKQLTGAIERAFAELVG
jgi:hypothetical protein